VFDKNLKSLFEILSTEDKAKSASVRKPRETRQDSSSSSLGASLVDGVRRIEQSNDVPGWCTHNDKMKDVSNQDI